MMPASRSSAKRCARATLFVRTAAAKPYGESLAMRSACSSLSNGMMTVPENLFTCDPHVRCDIGENGRLDIKPTASLEMLGHAATGNQPGTFVQSDPDKIEHALTLTLGNDRTH